MEKHVMYTFRILGSTLVVLCLAVLAAPVHAEWTSQTIALWPGWNAVYLEVQPADSSCDAVFAGIPVRSVWAWNKRFTSVQYVRNPSELVPEQPEWLTYFPPESNEAFLTNLYAVQAGQAYLVEMGGESTVHLVVTGKAVLRKKKWMADSFNLVGFSVDPANPPTFDAFFSSDDAVAGQSIYRLTASGKWRPVTAVGTETLASGEAYWVYCRGESSYSGPLSVELDTPDMLEFGYVLDELVLGLRNESSSAKTVTLNVVPADSVAAKSSDVPVAPLAGDVALSYKRLLSWAPISESMTVTVEPDTALGVQLGVRRADMGTDGTPDARYGSVLEISDGAGILYKVGVTAQLAGSHAGLWVGTATVNMVSEAGNPVDSTTPTPTGSEFSFRLIVHMDAEGNANLLRQCIIMQVDDSQSSEQTGGTGSSHYVLLTDEELISEYEGVSLRDGELVGRRISSPVFSFPEPVPMTGTFNTRLELASPLVLDYDDPLNPFVHRYHPDHDNMDDRYEILRDEGKESFTITRSITLDFAEEDPDGLNLPDWGYDLIGGQYYETITGIHKEDIHVQGQFRLNRVSSVDVLNDGN